MAEIVPMTQAEWDEEATRLSTHQDLDLVLARTVHALSLASFLYDVALVERFGEELALEARSWEEGKGEPGSKLRSAWQCHENALAYWRFVQQIALHRARPH